MALEDLDDGLKKALEKTTTNPHNTLEDNTVRVITVTNDGRKVIAIYPDEKAVEFYHEYPQTAPFMEELKPLVTFIREQGYTSNLD